MEICRHVSECFGALTAASSKELKAAETKAKQPETQAASNAKTAKVKDSKAEQTSAAKRARDTEKVGFLKLLLPESQAL